MYVGLSKALGMVWGKGEASTAVVPSQNQPTSELEFPAVFVQLRRQSQREAEVLQRVVAELE